MLRTDLPSSRDGFPNRGRRAEEYPSVVVARCCHSAQILLHVRPVSPIPSFGVDLSWKRVGYWRRKFELLIPACRIASNHASTNRALFRPVDFNWKNRSGAWAESILGTNAPFAGREFTTAWLWKSLIWAPYRLCHNDRHTFAWRDINFAGGIDNIGAITPPPIKPRGNVVIRSSAFDSTSELASSLRFMHGRSPKNPIASRTADRLPPDEIPLFSRLIRRWVPFSRQYSKLRCNYPFL